MALRGLKRPGPLREEAGERWVETFIRREDAERFIAEVRRDHSELASYLRIEERHRAFWLERFADSEIAEMALFMFGHRPDRAHICSERDRLLVPEGAQARQALRRPPEDSRAPSSVLPACGSTLQLSRLT
jgi:hypothetical protein